MSGCSEKVVIAKNLKLAMLLEQRRQKRKLIKDQNRDDLIRPVREEIESKILQLSRNDVSTCGAGEKQLDRPPQQTSESGRIEGLNLRSANRSNSTTRRP